VLGKLYDLGLMGFVDGSKPTRLRFLPPPGVTTNEQIDIAVGIIETALQSMESKKA